VRTLVRSLIRISAGVLLGLALLVGGFGFWIRQPIFGSVAFPEGPRADPHRLQAHVERLCAQPRDALFSTGVEMAADYIAASFAKTGSRVTEQRYATGRATSRNIVARFGDQPGPLLVIGAHYDAYGGMPGADDNASGVAGLLELARLLDARRPGSPIELVAWSTEEPPFFGGPGMGSAVHARLLVENAVDVRAMIGLEMIGFFTRRQPYSNLPLYLIYPWSGDFVALVGRPADRALVRRSKRIFRGAASVPVVSYSGPVGFGSDLSDHRNYWDAGYPAIMVTDTAFWRNPHYHTEDDLPDTLDYTRMAGVVDGVLALALHLSEGTAP
jgi:Zn-dependent M28 family amino/carboxypeptidase